MSRPRDSQRSRVYRWERSIPGLQLGRGTLSLEEAETLVKRVWRKERGRYGLARRPAPRVEAGRGGGTAYGSYMTLGRWARQPCVVLHELAHCLNRQHPTESNIGHGPRFVGIAIGLYCRYLGCDRDELLAAADEYGVRVNRTAVGKTPEFGWHRRAERALERLRGYAANEIELAYEMGVGYRVARGSILKLLQLGRVHRRGRAILLIRPELQQAIAEFERKLS